MDTFINGAKIYYQIIGTGTPVIMLHGWGVDHKIMSGCMEPVFESGLQNFQRIYIDLPGMGKSKESDRIKNSDNMLEIISQLIDTIIPNKKFILVGESYGGYLSRGMVKQRPEQVLGLLLICPLIIPGYRMGKVPELKVMESDDIFLSELSEAERKSFEYISVIRTREVWKRFKSDIYDSLSLHNSYFLNEVLDGAFSYDVDTLEKPFDKPCLILTGRNDTEVGYQDQFKLLENYSSASYMVFDRAGHNLQIEQAEQFTSAARQWLNLYFNIF